MRWQLPRVAVARKGKRRTIIATAVARELAAFIWAIGRKVGPPRTA
jgi:transposase